MIKISKITIVRISGGADKLYLKTTLPSGVWPFDGEQTLETDVACGLGEEYVNKYFPGVEFEVKDA